MTFSYQDLPFALETDKVLTVDQCLRHFGTEPRTLPRLGLHTFTHDVGRTTHCIREPSWRFVTHERRFKNLRTSSLRHLAGLAEMRLRLKADPRDWLVFLKRPDQGRMPDGQYSYKGERCALEFDAGSYKRDRVLEKMRAYAQAFDSQLWGAGTDARISYLQACASDVPGKIYVMSAPWFQKSSAPFF